MLRQNKSILGFLTVAFCVASANGAKRGYKPPAEEKRISGKDIRDMTKLLEHQCPFPEETMAQNCRISWKYAGALARATSLHQTCVYVHLLVMLSLVLNAVQVRYGGILGKFPNLLMIQHGEAGDGKSIALWLILQILYYFDSIKTKHDAASYRHELRQYEDAKKTFEQQGPDGDMEEPLPPQKPDKRDSVQSKGTFYGALDSACLCFKKVSMFIEGDWLCMFKERDCLCETLVSF